MMSYMQGTVTASAAYIQAVGDRGTWGLSGRFMDYGEMKEMNAVGEQTGTFKARDVAVAGTFSYGLSDYFSGGVTARLAASYMGNYNSLAALVDLGLNYYDADSEWSLSAVAKNLGGELKAYDEEYGSMPLDVQLGVSKRLANSPIRLSASLVDLNHWNYKFINHWVAGIDLLLSEQFYLAAGYNFRRANEMKIVANDEEKGSSHGAGISLGAGLLLDRFKLNVAYGKYHVSSSSLLINLSYSL
jgi:hypothetical protein